MTTIDKLKGYSTFAEIENKLLRAYNQYTVLSNMRENGLINLGHDYLEALPAGDRMSLAFFTEYVKRKGYEETKREIFAKAA